MFLSLPLDDWDKPSEGPAVVRTVGTRVAPDPARLDEFADALRHASSPVMIYGAAIARGNGWSEATALAEALNAPVWAAPASERTPFPEDHPLSRIEDLDALKQAAANAWTNYVPTVLEVSVSGQVPPLV